MSERAAYSRVYWSIIDDEKFKDVYDDDRALATWLRLLLVADQAWPASAHLPTHARRPAVAVLVKAGLVDLQPGARYRIHGLDAERNRRKDAATRGPKSDPPGTQAGPSWDPDGPRTTGLRRDETRRDETSRADAGASGESDPYDEAVRWLAQRKAWIDSSKIQTALARLVDKKGAPAVIAAMANVAGAEDAAQFVYGARNALFPLNGSTVTQDSPEQRAERERLERRRSLGLEPVQ